MSKLSYNIAINAPKEKVWDAMLSDTTYREWTAAFHPGSYYDGSWDKGSEIRFLAEDDGGQSGMLGQIVENIPYEFISISQLGEIKNGKVDTTSEDVQQWIGSFENYRFTQEGGITTVVVELDGENISSDMISMFDGMWPAALRKLKEIVERN